MRDGYSDFFPNRYSEEETLEKNLKSEEERNFMTRTGDKKHMKIIT